MAFLPGNDWDAFFERETAKEYYRELRGFLAGEYRSRAVFPPMGDIFNAFRLTPLSGLKVVILGQDPYIHQGEAHGLAFSVNMGVKTPPSLANIFKELRDDLGIVPPEHGCLEGWARAGVMLLNNTLTVREGVSKSHAGKGWETFTAAAVREICGIDRPVVFMLWGRDAGQKAELLNNPRHLTLTAAHPSPLAGGKFFGCRHFSRANAFLEEHGVAGVDWRL